MKTIKQLADEIGVSKQAVQQRLNKPPLVDTAKPLLVMLAGTWRVPAEAETLILSAFSDAPTSKPTSKSATLADNVVDKEPTSVVGELVSMLQQELHEKNTQISGQQATIDQLTSTVQEQARQIDTLTKSVLAAQALHAGTMQQQLQAPATEPEPATPPEQPRRSWWPFGRNK